MKTTIACMEREYFEDYLSEIADGHERRFYLVKEVCYVIVKNKSIYIELL